MQAKASILSFPAKQRRSCGMELSAVRIDKPADINLILGQSHFIETV